MNNPISPRASAPYRRPLFLVVILAGCGGQGAWRKAYDENYKSSYAEAAEFGRVAGSKDGVTRGATEAELAVRTGHAWRPYTAYFGWSLFCGTVGGIFLQYLV